MAKKETKKDASGGEQTPGTPKPTLKNGGAYAGGTDIHIKPGDETHIPHESWHVETDKPKPKPKPGKK